MTLALRTRRRRCACGILSADRERMHARGHAGTAAGAISSSPAGVYAEVGGQHEVFIFSNPRAKIELLSIDYSASWLQAYNRNFIDEFEQKKIPYKIGVDNEMGFLIKLRERFAGREETVHTILGDLIGKNNVLKNGPGTYVLTLYSLLYMAGRTFNIVGVAVTVLSVNGIIAPNPALQNILGDNRSTRL